MKTKEVKNSAIPAISPTAKDISEKVSEEITTRNITLFEADFNVYADRGDNCYKSPATNDVNIRI